MTSYTITEARYTKGKMVITPKDNANGFKGRAANLIEAKGFGAKWVSRYKGYVVSKAAAARFEKMFDMGYVAHLGSEPYLPLGAS